MLNYSARFVKKTFATFSFSVLRVATALLSLVSKTFIFCIEPEVFLISTVVAIEDIKRIRVARWSSG